jgi:hypothetical protein
MADQAFSRESRDKVPAAGSRLVAVEKELIETYSGERS